jgi:hypothetical protein
MQCSTIWTTGFNVKPTPSAPIALGAPSRDDRLACESAPLDLMAPLKVRSIIYILLIAFETTVTIFKNRLVIFLPDLQSILMPN